MTDQLFSPAYAEPIQPDSQVDRIPGTPDAPCHCGRDTCRWPFSESCWKTDEEPHEKP